MADISDVKVQNIYIRNVSMSGILNIWAIIVKN